MYKCIIKRTGPYVSKVKVWFTHVEENENFILGEPWPSSEDVTKTMTPLLRKMYLSTPTKFFIHSLRIYRLPNSELCALKEGVFSAGVGVVEKNGLGKVGRGGKHSVCP